MARREWRQHLRLQQVAIFVDRGGDVLIFVPGGSAFLAFCHLHFGAKLRKEARSLLRVDLLDQVLQGLVEAVDVGAIPASPLF
eukprot:847545-Pyramimonas_sp.AAC.1